jgi:hypothetical protein
MSTISNPYEGLARPGDGRPSQAVEGSGNRRDVVRPTRWE